MLLGEGDCNLEDITQDGVCKAVVVLWVGLGLKV